MQARALVIDQVNSVQVREVTVRDPGPGEVILEVLYSCVSPGTELRCMRGKQEGTKFPYIPGYSHVGRVLKVGPGVDLPIGTVCASSSTRHADGVHLTWGGHISHAVAGARDLRPLPPGVDPLEASIARIASIAYHGMLLSQPRPGERVVVLGLGPIGQLAACMHQLAGAQVLGLDRAPERMASARANGIAVGDASADPVAAMKAVFPDGADIVVDATGAAAAMATGIELAKDIPWGDPTVRGPRYLVQGSYADTFTVPYMRAFWKELTFLLPRDATLADRDAVVEAMGRKQLRLRGMITSVLEPKDAAEGYRLLAEDPRQVTIAFRWS